MTSRLGIGSELVGYGCVGTVMMGLILQCLVALLRSSWYCRACKSGKQRLLLGANNGRHIDGLMGRQQGRRQRSCADWALLLCGTLLAKKYRVLQYCRAYPSPLTVENGTNIGRGWLRDFYLVVKPREKPNERYVGAPSRVSARSKSCLKCLSTSRNRCFNSVN